MQSFEQRVIEMMHQHEVLVAVFSTRPPSILDGMEAKRAFRAFQLEILNRDEPSMFQDWVMRTMGKTFIFGVTARMKEHDECYLADFLNACGDGSNITEIFGMTMDGT